jgi:hypothetical protein
MFLQNKVCKAEIKDENLGSEKIEQTARQHKKDFLERFHTIL